MVSVELREGEGKLRWLSLMTRWKGQRRANKMQFRKSRGRGEGEFIGHLVVQRNEIKRHSSFLLLPPPPPILHSCEVGLFSPPFFSCFSSVFSP